LKKSIREISETDPPFETKELRSGLEGFLKKEFADEKGGLARKIGSYQYGIYAFYDYDGEPIYVGQTAEKISTRIRRHLTNQRTDAVAMNVLDPFEVFEIEVWPIAEISGDEKVVTETLNKLEYLAYKKVIKDSSFNAVLNEVEPKDSHVKAALPKSFRAVVVSNGVSNLRAHPDIRLARRALVLSKLAQVISERKVQTGLRATLLTQAKRLAYLAESRLSAIKGTKIDEDED
jgi:hypothetical protein